MEFQVLPAVLSIQLPGHFFVPVYQYQMGVLSLPAIFFNDIIITIEQLSNLCRNCLVDRCIVWVLKNSNGEYRAGLLYTILPLKI
jgi:hypothetical protein